jgi:C_GCAxxG_C_C family probable redox protein
VLQAVCQEFEIDVEKDVLLRAACGFAGGLGNTGFICGSVVGAVMAIGLKRGRPDSEEGSLREARLLQEFRRRFEAEMGTISCRELTGADLTTEEGIQEFMSSDTPQNVCFPAVGVAYRLVVDLLKETEQEEGGSS